MNLDLTATPIIVADGGGRVIYKNAAAKKLLPGCRKGTPLYVIFPQLDMILICR